jgi:sortase A
VRFPGRVRTGTIEGQPRRWATAKHLETTDAQSERTSLRTRPVMRSSGPGRHLDLRTVARRLGGLLMIAGGLVLGFVAFQLWGTGIEHANAQRELRTEFEQSLADAKLESPSAATVPPATSMRREPESPGLVPTSRRPATADVTTMPSRPPTTTLPATTVPPTTAPQPTTVPPTTVPPTTAPPPTVPPQPVFAPGDPVARLEIPRIGVDEIVVSGVGVEDLKKGPGHYPGTPLPGQPGNAAIAGHRTTYGAPFFSIDELVPGDEIIATTYAGRFVYRVTGTVVVPPTEVGVIAGTSDARLALTSCHPLYSASSRIVVTAQLDVEHSTPVTTVPPSTTAPVRPRPTATTAAPKRVTRTTASTTTAARRSATTTTTSTTTTSTTTTVPPESGPASSIPLADAFGGAGGSSAQPSAPTGAAAPSLSTGWFDDLGALVDLLLWGAVGVLVVLIVRLASRRVGHRLLFSALGVVPFAVALFFFYENINRVLPAGV